MSDKDIDLKSFHMLLTRLESGGLAEELTEKMKKCVTEISDAAFDRGGKHKASLAVKIEFSLDAKDRIIEVSADISEKYPKAPRGRGGMFFADSDGNLTRENPSQMSFEDELQRKRLKDAEAVVGQ